MANLIKEIRLSHLPTGDVEFHFEFASLSQAAYPFELRSPKYDFAVLGLKMHNRIKVPDYMLFAALAVSIIERKSYANIASLMQMKCNFNVIYQ